MDSGTRGLPESPQVTLMFISFEDSSRAAFLLQGVSAAQPESRGLGDMVCDKHENGKKFTSSWSCSAWTESSTPFKSSMLKLELPGQSTEFQDSTNRARSPSSAPPGVSRFGRTLVRRGIRLRFSLGGSRALASDEEAAWRFFLSLARATN